MANATHSRMLSRLAAACACSDINARPSTIAQVHALMSAERMPVRLLSWLLSAAAVVLLVFIGTTLYRHRTIQNNAQASATEQISASADTTLTNGGNQVLDRSCWP